jgi:hypothetical protein
MLRKTGNFKKAFNCKKCPQRGDENGCPMWWELPVEDDSDQTKQDIMAGCGYQLLPFVLRSVVKAGWTGAAEVSAMRQEVVTSVENATERFLQLQRLQEEQPSDRQLERRGQPHDRLVLEGRHGRDDTGNSVDVRDNCGRD